MKKILHVLALLFISQLLPAQVVITEIMYNPPESGTDSLEYIELHNAGASAVDVAGWSFSQGFEFTFPAGAMLQAGQYIVISKFSGHFQSKFGFAPDYEWDAGGALTNTGEDIELLNSSGNVVDYVDYKNVAPWPTGAAGGGPSIVLCDPLADNNVGANWSDCTTATGIIVNNLEVFANPQAPSDCPTGILANDDMFSLSPGQANTFNPTNNDFMPDPENTFLTVIINPLQGTWVVNNDNSVTYTPSGNYCGPDVFTYKICDQSGCDTAVVTLDIKCYPQYTIAQVTGINAEGVADSIGVACALTATVYGVNLRPSGIQITIIDDNNNGIVPFRPSGDLGYTVLEGDKVTVQGTIGQFNGLTQISVDNIFKVSGNNPLVTPLTVIEPSESTESKLIRIENLELVDPAQWATGQGTGFTAEAESSDHPGVIVSIRVDNDVELFNQPAPTTPFNLTGIGGQFDSSSPYTSGYQIQPRYAADLQPIVGTKEVDFSHLVTLAPNPVTDLLRINTSARFDRVELSATDGRLLQTLKNLEGETSIDTGRLPAGVYLLRFFQGNGAWTTRIVRM